VDAPIVYCIAYASKHDVGVSMMELRHGYGQGIVKALRSLASLNLERA
jgi:hypothetical protein